MRRVAELHDLKYPLHEYQCRRIPTSGGQGVYVVPDTFDFGPNTPFMREYLAVDCTAEEALSLLAETQRLIEAAKRIAT